MLSIDNARNELALTDDQADALVAVHNRTVDALAGYAKMVEKAEPSFKGVADEFRALHAAHAEKLSRMLAGAGREADPDGTLMGTVNTAVVSLRAMVDTIDEDVMDNIRNGENWVLEAFDDAIEETDDSTLALSLADMREELTELLQRTSNLD